MVCEWCPSKLLCKRFNIADPYKNRGNLVKKTKSKDDILNEKTLNKLIFQRDIDQGKKTIERKLNPSMFNNNDDKNKLEFDKEKDEVMDKQKEEENNNNNNDKIETFIRPPMDLFKTIFDGSDSDSDSDSDSESDELGFSSNSHKGENKVIKKLPNEEIITTAQHHPFDETIDDDKKENSHMLDEQNLKIKPINNDNEKGINN